MKLIACSKALFLPVKDQRSIIFKIPLVMKLTAIFLLLFCMQISAETVGQNITLSEKKASLKEVLKKIRHQSGVVFFYDEELLKKSNSMDISVKNATLTEVLTIVFQKQNLLTYEIIDNKIITIKERNPDLIEKKPTNFLPPVDTTITGVVTDDKGVPMSGVTITVRGVKNSSAISNEEGHYSIKVPDSRAALIFSYVGFKEVVQNVGSASVLNIHMNPEANIMSDIVVVGYGNQQKRDVTGSIGSVSGSEIKNLAVGRIDQALLGKVAGVQVKPATGEPGAAPKILIRGIGSISAGSNPLYVVDGFPTGNIDMLNPNDIASIDILKDASATAIYGSRGANGVVIITTARGKTGKAEVTFDTYRGWQKIAHRPDMMNARESAQYYYDGVRNHNLDAGNDVSGPPRQWKIIVPQIVLDVLEGRNTYDKDALDQVLQTAGQQNYQLAFRGGTDNIKYYVSGNFLNQDGVIINSNFKRYSVNANLDFKVSQRLSLKMSLSPSYTTTNEIQAAGGDGGTASEGIIGSALYVHNYHSLYVDAQGNPATENGDYLVFSGLESQGAIVNALALATEIKASRKKAGVLGNINLEYKILPDLTFNVLLGGTVMNSRGSRFKPQLPAFFNNPAVGRSESSMSTNWLTEYTLSYNKAIGKHNMAALGGYTVQKDLFEFNSLTSDKYPNNLVPTLNAVSGVISGGTSDISEWSMLSYLSRINYNYSSKYYLTASIRTDGSSRFGADKKWGVFPSAAFAWRVTEESFAKDLNFLNDLKLRVSYGETGNNNIGNYEHQSTIRYLLYPLGGLLNNAYAPQRIENRLLTWETQKQVNFGIDIGIFNKRVNLTIDHFQSRNEDLLLNVTIPAVTGFGNTLKNIGEVKNTGWEFTLNTINLNGKLNWTTDFNISSYKNEVVKLGPKGDPIYAGASVTMIGKPIGSYYGWLTDGIFLNQAEVNKGPVFNPTGADRSRPGDVRFVDVSGPDGKPDGIINGLDKTIMGNPYPDFYYGMTNRLSFKNLTFGITLQGVYGNDVFAATRGTIANSRARYRQQAHLLNYWKSESDPGDGKTPRPNNQPSGNFRGGFSQLWLDDGSYLRVNNISLGYLFSKKVTESLKMNSLRFYITATNPFLFTNYRQFNPDVSNNGSSLEPNIDINDYPLQKSLIVGINVTF